MKKIPESLINKMVETIEHIRDAEKNADAFYSKETILHNMNNYFSGITIAIEEMTGREYHWGYNGTNYRLVEIVNGEEKTIKTI